MKVLGLSGSLRAGSHNSKLLRAAGDLLPGEAELVEFDGLKLIPPFDEDDEHIRPEEVQALFDAIAEADAVLVSTPEYNHSIPGQLKNALDWLSRPAGRVAAAQQARRGRRRLHRPLRRGLGPGRSPQGPLRHRRPRDRPRAPDRHGRRRLPRAGPLVDEDLSLALAGILAELHAETREPHRFQDSPFTPLARRARPSAF